MRVAMTDVQHPTAVRRAVSFCTAVFDGACDVEGVSGRLHSLDEWEMLEGRGLEHVPVFVDPGGLLVGRWRPDVIVDARILKRNDGNSIEQAPLLIGLGPGLRAGQDVHVVIETLRGHDLGRIIRTGFAAADTGIPGTIAGYAAERVLRAPCAGVVESVLDIGQPVGAGDVVCTVSGRPVRSELSGALRGVVHGGVEVPAGLKVADVDPRGGRSLCFTISDKARTISGSVLEAILSRFPPGFQ
jgi:xanthine dehydrogenase accessory factor